MLLSAVKVSGFVQRAKEMLNFFFVLRLIRVFGALFIKTSLKQRHLFDLSRSVTRLKGQEILASKGRSVKLEGLAVQQIRDKDLQRLFYGRKKGR